MQSRQPRLGDYIDRDRNPGNWPMVLTDRDSRILEHIYEYDGCLADYQVKELEFTGMRQAQDRLGKLFHNGYLLRTNRMGRTRYGCTLYWLDKAGIDFVAAAKGEEVKDLNFIKEPGWNSMEHDLRVNDFTIILQKACQKYPEFELYEWVNESVLRADPTQVEYETVAGKPARRQVIPDRFFLVHRLGEDRFRSRLLLELDNATHPNKRFADHKILPGIAFIRSPEYEKKFGGNSGRWLIVTTSDRRLKYLKETTERVADNNDVIFYFTTFERVRVDTILTEPIWYRGGSEQPVALFPPQARK